MGRISLLEHGWATTAEAAVILNTTVPYVEKLRKLGKLHPSHMGRLLLYRVEDLLAYRAHHPKTARTIKTA